MIEKRRKIALLTSGGDAPGMNAAIRALVRILTSKGHQVYGVERGYQGLIDQKSIPMSLRSVANYIQKGGTVLKTSRCEEFKTREGRKKAYDYLKLKSVDTLIVLGGDGSLKGLELLDNEFPDITCIGIPCTIDNDYIYSSNCIGVDTATNTAVSAIDKVRDTAGSHERTFVIEVMGRNSAFLANNVALAAGAECVVDLSKEGSLESALSRVKASAERGKLTSLLVVLESIDPKLDAASYVRDKVKALGLETRALVLGHLQRGGAPTAADRILASKLASKASELIGSGVVIVDESEEIYFKPWSQLKQILNDMNETAELISVLAN